MLELTSQPISFERVTEFDERYKDVHVTKNLDVQKAIPALPTDHQKLADIAITNRGKGFEITVRLWT